MGSTSDLAPWSSSDLAPWSSSDLAPSSSSDLAPSSGKIGSPPSRAPPRGVVLARARARAHPHRRAGLREERAVSSPRGGGRSLHAVQPGRHDRGGGWDEHPRHRRHARVGVVPRFGVRRVRKGGQAGARGRLRVDPHRRRRRRRRRPRRTRKRDVQPEKGETTRPFARTARTRRSRPTRHPSSLVASPPPLVVSSPLAFPLFPFTETPPRSKPCEGSAT